MTRHANLAGKGHEKQVRNHCDAYSTGSAVYSCTWHQFTPLVHDALGLLICMEGQAMENTLPQQAENDSRAPV